MESLKIDAEGGPVNSEDLVHEFIRQIRVERGLSPNTQAAYCYQLAGYVKFLQERRKSPTSAVKEDVLAYLESLQMRHLKSASRYLAAICIRQFHRYLATTGHAIAAPIDLKLPKIGERLPDPLTAGEMECLLAIPTGGKFYRIRMKAGLEIMYSTGLRVSELVNLKLSGINLDEGWIRAIGKGDRERLVPIGHKAKDALHLYMEARRSRPGAGLDALFLTSRGRHWTRGAFWWQLRKLAKEAGVLGRVHPHRIRHAFGAILTARGVGLRAIQQNLGHRHSVTTEIYTRITPDQIRAALEGAHPRF